jgi:hypothetical protein
MKLVIHKENTLTIILMSLSLFVFNIAAAQAQRILRVSGNYVLIDISRSSGLKVGDQINVFGKSASGDEIIVGKVQIVEFRNDQCAATIVTKNSQYKISVGDKVAVNDSESIDYLFKDDEQENTFRSNQNSFSRNDPNPSRASYGPRKSNTFSAVLIGSGVVAAGLAYYFNDKANDTYDDYQNANTTDKAISYYKDTASLDQNAQISMGVGGGLIALGIIKILLNRSNQSQYSANQFQIDTVNRQSYAGLKISFNINKISAPFSHSAD